LGYEWARENRFCGDGLEWRKSLPEGTTQAEACKLCQNGQRRNKKVKLKTKRTIHIITLFTMWFIFTLLLVLFGPSNVTIGFKITLASIISFMGITAMGLIAWLIKTYINFNDED